MSRPADERRPTPGVPPWMWLWVVLFSLHLIPLVGEFSGEYRGLLAQSEKMVEEIDPEKMPLVGVLSFALYSEILLRLVPAATLALGLLPILFPHLRARYIERRHGLGAAPPAFTALAEIEGFVAARAPGLRVKTNLRRPGRVWIYPHGYRGATLAVFAGFVLLWKSDRQAAESVLMHEIMHYRRGDGLFMGPGSFLENAVKLNLIFNAACVLLPWLVVLVIVNVFVPRELAGLNEFQSYEKMAAESGLSAYVSSHVSFMLLVNLYLAFHLVVITAGVMVTLFNFFVVPVACMWAAEFNADHCVAGDARYREGVLRELSKKIGGVSLWRRALFRLSHPPERLRRFFLRRHDSPAFSLLLLLFPLAFFVPLLVSFAFVALVLAGLNVVAPPLGLDPREVASAMMPVPSWGELWPSYFQFGREFVAGLKYFWLAMTALLLAWPFAARPWERFFTRGEPGTADAAGATTAPGFKYYAAVAVVTGALSMAGFLWQE
jgi:hypothetical protein